jgi:hypothetical protein
MLAILVWLAWPGRSTFTLGPETTYVSAPLDGHGYVDYTKELNERLRAETTPASNANVLIWKAIGPHPYETQMPREYFKRLGAAAPAADGDYFLTFNQFLKKHLNVTRTDALRDFAGRLKRNCQNVWTAKDDPKLAQWLRLNDKPLQVLIEASRRREYYNPLVPERTDGASAPLFLASLDNVAECREAAEALACRAMLRLAGGKIDDAWQDLLACHRLGRLISHGGTLVELSVGATIDETASRADLVFLDRASLNSKQISNCFDDLQRLQAMGPVIEKIDVHLRFMFLHSVMFLSGQRTEDLQGQLAAFGAAPKDGAASQKLFTRSVDWDLALRNINRFCDRCVEAARRADSAERLQALGQLEQEIRAARDEADAGFFERFLMTPSARGEAIVNLLLGSLLPNLSETLAGAQRAADESEQTRRNLHLAFALAEFRSDTGRYPARLAELTPKYLDRIPNDLFSHRSPIYKPDGKGYLLASVGPNGVDDTSQAPDARPHGDDIAVRMPISISP